jgi:hypothetical protein
MFSISYVTTDVYSVAAKVLHVRLKIRVKNCWQIKLLKAGTYLNKLKTRSCYSSFFLGCGKEPSASINVH